MSRPLYRAFGLLAFAGITVFGIASSAPANTDKAVPLLPNEPRPLPVGGGAKQEGKKPSVAPPTITVKTPNPPTIDEVRAVNGSADQTQVSIHLKQTLVLVVTDKDNWIGATTANGKPIVLFLNSRPISKLPTRVNAAPIGGDGKKIELIFDLVRTKENKDAWDALIGDYTFWQKVEGKEVSVSIGTDSSAVSASASSITLFPFARYGLLSILLIVVEIVLLVLFYLKSKKDMLRNAGPEPRPGKRRSFSLGRCQMAFWFFLVISSAAFVVAFTGDPASLIFPTSVLALMGISSATTLSAVGVEIAYSNEKLERIKTLRPLLPEKAASDQLEEKEKTGALTPDEKKQLENVREFDALTLPSRSFFGDILSNGEVPALHRLQMLGWTLVLAVVFLWTVVYTLKMPDFDNTLLLLMGITNFTYVGFKVPEARPQQSNPRPS